MATLEQVLGEAPMPESTPEAKTEPQEAAPEPEAPAESAKPTGEKPQAEKAEDKAESPPDSEPNAVPLAAHIELRKDMQRKIDALQAQVKDKPEEPEPKPDFFEDPEGAIGALEQKFSRQLTNQLLNEGEAEAVRQHGKDVVETAVEWFTETAKDSPYLAQQFSSTPLLQQHRKVVELYQQEQARAEMADPEKLREQIRAEERAKLEAELKDQQKKAKDLRDSVPESLVGDPSKGSLKGSDWGGPTPIESVIGRGA